MNHRTRAVFAATALICLIPALGLAVEPYSQDFETLIQPDPSALANDGWLVFGNVFDPDDNYLYGYGPFPAPNDGSAFCQIDIGQGGPDQGAQQLVVFSDYNNLDHANGNTIESNVYQEQTVEEADVGIIWSFDFDAKLGNLAGASTAAAFIKTLDPDNGFVLTNFISRDMTSTPTTWTRYGIMISITEDLVGQLLQIGFLNTATNYESSGVFYDNIDFYEAALVDVPDGATLAGATLRQNYPNPFNPRTRIDFALENPGSVDISVFDLAGRRVATLRQGTLAAGEHHVIWDGTTDSGLPAASGRYRYVLKTAAGQASRGMVLLK